jgi:phenylpropionate dioxygenase-like ring-hydroxylating dioxygenase large terminal subunit
VSADRGNAAVYRGDSGTAYLVDDRCPHRQASQFTGWVKGETIRCFNQYYAFLKKEAP